MAALGGRLVEVGGLPGEAVAQRVPLDAQVVGQLALARLPLPALDELDDSDGPPSGPAPSHDPERRARLPLPVAGVDEDDRRGTRHRSQTTFGRAAQGSRWKSVTVPQL